MHIFCVGSKLFNITKINKKKLKPKQGGRKKGFIYFDKKI